MNEPNQTEIVATAVTEANGLTTTLQLLRGDRVKQAMEQLEVQLDLRVVWLDQLSREAPTQDRRFITETLESIRNYRRLYPRRAEVNIDWMKAELVANIRDKQRQAQNILEKIK